MDVLSVFLPTRYLLHREILIEFWSRLKSLDEEKMPA